MEEWIKGNEKGKYGAINDLLEMEDIKDKTGGKKYYEIKKQGFFYNITKP